MSRLLAAALFAAILAPLNSTLLAVLLPAVAADLRVTTSSATWLITGYLVLLGVMQSVGGRLGDRFRRRPLMLGGLTAFCAATLAMAFAQLYGPIRPPTRPGGPVSGTRRYPGRSGQSAAQLFLDSCSLGPFGPVSS